MTTCEAQSPGDWYWGVSGRPGPPEPISINVFDGDEITVNAVDGQLIVSTPLGEVSVHEGDELVPFILQPQGDRQAWRDRKGF